MFFLFEVKEMRLDKFLSHTGFGSRKEVKELVKKKRVSVNDVLVKDGKCNINQGADRVKVDGKDVFYQEFVYYMMNKPKGVLSATEDNHQRTVIDLITPEDNIWSVFPVGRLDKDTTGLLLLTNDGDLAHQLLSPKKKVTKLYEAKVAGLMTEEDIQTFSEGIILKSGEACLPATLKIISRDEVKEQSMIHLEIMEGKFHQVKRMVEAVGKKVVELERLRMGSLCLDQSLERGNYRPLTKLELDELMSLTGQTNQR